MKFFFIYRLTIFEILFDLEDLNDNELNGAPIYTIQFIGGSDTSQDSDKSNDEREENRCNKMLMSIKWCQRFVERRGAVNIFHSKVVFQYNTRMTY